MGLGLRPTARELGISHVALLKAFTTGRVPKEADGTFDVETCRKALASNSHPIKSQSARKQQANHPAAEMKPAAPEIRAQVPEVQKLAPVVDGEPAPGSIAEATQQLEWLRVREKQLKLDRESASLVDADEFREKFGSMLNTAKSRLMLVAAKLGHKLAAEKDPIACQQLVEVEIRKALTELSRYEHAA